MIAQPEKTCYTPDAYLEMEIHSNDRHWRFTEYEATDTSIALQSISCDVEIADLYAKVVFEPPPELN